MIFRINVWQKKVQLSNIENDNESILQDNNYQIEGSSLNINAQSLNTNFTSALRSLNLSGNKVILFKFF